MQQRIATFFRDVDIYIVVVSETSLIKSRCFSWSEFNISSDTENIRLES